ENPLRNRRTEPDQPSRADSGDQVPRRPGIQRLSRNSNNNILFIYHFPVFYREDYPKI
ncbi:MAG: hypothetical protein, partial [Olavius algarvensis Gamma 1 endosymbiont]